MNYLFVLLLPLALLEMKIWLSVRDWIDILDVSCGPWLIDISFLFFFPFTFSMDCTFPRSSALISSPTIQCDIQQKKILSLFIQSLALVSSLSGIFFFLVVLSGVDALDSAWVWVCGFLFSFRQSYFSSGICFHSCSVLLVRLGMI